MPIPLPNLDDRRWADLVEEGRSLIPFLTPEWTDHNASDPGITLMELFASVAEMDIFQLNRIPERQRRRMLSLVGVRQQPPEPARVLLELRLSGGASPVDIAAGLDCLAPGASGGPLPFRTLHPVRVADSRIEAVQTRDGAAWSNLSAQLERGETALLFGPDPAPGAEAYLGFSEALPAGEVTLGFVLDSSATSPAASGPHHSARIQWEYMAAADQWIAVESDDHSCSPTRNGVVHLAIPGAIAGARIGAVSKTLYYLRCRLQGWLDSPPRLSKVFLNAVEAWQVARPAVTTAPNTPPDYPDAVSAGPLDGGPNQVVALPGSPAVEASLDLFTLEDGEWQEWERRDDLIASGPGDSHFVLAADTGKVTFGDGNRGRVAAAGTPVAASYLITRGFAGRVDSGAVTVVADTAHNAALPGYADWKPRLTVTNPAPSEGGRDEESVASAIGRAMELREARLRAVTLGDMEALAMATPGTHIRRAHAIANHVPGMGCIKALGVITLVIVPAGGGGRPFPSAGLLNAVGAQIEGRRLLGTRIEIVGPEYVEAAVVGKVRALEGAGKERVREQVLETLRAFFQPLSGGPDRKGWPMGRDIYRSEVMQAIDGVAGVDHVISLELRAEGCPAVCGNLCIPRTALAASGEHRIEVI